MFDYSNAIHSCIDIVNWNIYVIFIKLSIVNMYNFTKDF